MVHLATCAVAVRPSASTGSVRYWRTRAPTSPVEGGGERRSLPVGRRRQVRDRPEPRAGAPCRHAVGLVEHRDVICERSHVRWLVWSVAARRRDDRSTPRCSSAARLNVGRPPPRRSDRPSDFATGASASSTCWAGSRVGTRTARAAAATGPGRLQPGQRREPEPGSCRRPVWPRPSRSRPAEGVGERRGLDGERSEEPFAARVRTTGSGRPSSAKEGMPASGTVHSCSAGATAATTGRVSGQRERPRGERVRPASERRGPAARRELRASLEARQTLGTASGRGRQVEPPGRGTSHGEAAPRWRRLGSRDEPRAHRYAP